MKVAERFKIFKPCKLPGEEKKSALMERFLDLYRFSCLLYVTFKAGKLLVVDNSCLFL